VSRVTAGVQFTGFHRLADILAGKLPTIGSMSEWGSRGHLQQVPPQAIAMKERDALWHG